MLADELTHAGAVMVARGSRSVCAHFGSVGAEESVCRKHVGIALRADLDVLVRDVRSGDPEVGRAVRNGGVWHARFAPERVLAIGAGGAAGLDVISVVGPRAAALLAHCELPVGAPGDVALSWWCGAFAAVLRESSDRHLLVVGAEHAADAWHALLAAGRPLEVACVGVDALARLAAAGNVRRP